MRRTLLTGGINLTAEQAKPVHQGYLVQLALLARAGSTLLTIIVNLTALALDANRQVRMLECYGVVEPKIGLVGGPLCGLVDDIVVVMEVHMVQAADVARDNPSV